MRSKSSCRFGAVLSWVVLCKRLRLVCTAVPSAVYSVTPQSAGLPPPLSSLYHSLLHSCHTGPTGFLYVPRAHRGLPLVAFDLAVPSALNVLVQIWAWLASSHHSGPPLKRCSLTSLPTEAIQELSFPAPWFIFFITAIPIIFSLVHHFTVSLPH